MSKRLSGRNPKYMLKDMQNCLSHMYEAALEKDAKAHKIHLTEGQKDMLHNTVKWCNRMLVQHKRCPNCSDFTERLIGENLTVYEQECRVCGCRQISVRPTVEDDAIDTPIVECGDCVHRNKTTSVCDIWGKEVDADGFCYKSKEREYHGIESDEEIYNLPLSLDEFDEDYEDSDPESEEYE